MHAHTCRPPRPNMHTVSSHICTKTITHTRMDPKKVRKNPSLVPFWPSTIWHSRIPSTTGKSPSLHSGDSDAPSTTSSGWFIAERWQPSQFRNYTSAGTGGCPQRGPAGVTPSHTCKCDSPKALPIDNAWMPAVDGMLSTLSQRKAAA